MEVMNVPMSRSRISIAPSMVKRGKGHTPSHKGEGVMDILKSVGKVVAPIAIDLASDYAKGKLGGMAMPIMVSAAQKRTLKKGGAITIKPEMVSDVAKQALAMLPATAKKVLGALSKNKGIRVSLKQGEDLVDRMTGKGLFDVLKSIGKVVAPIAIDLASKEAKRRVKGDGVMDVLKEVGKVVAPIAIDLASKEAKRRVGGTMRRVNVMTGCGSPYVSAPYRQAIEFHSEGGSIFPAGGSGIYPAGKYGGMMSGCGMPIQTGSPYINQSSPANHPFMPTRGIQSYDPIGRK